MCADFLINCLSCCLSVMRHKPPPTRYTYRDIKKIDIADFDKRLQYSDLYTAQGQRKILVEKFHSIVRCSFVERRIVATSSQSPWRAERQVDIRVVHRRKQAPSGPTALCPTVVDFRQVDQAAIPPDCRYTAQDVRSPSSFSTPSTARPCPPTTVAVTVPAATACSAADRRCSFAAFFGTTCIVLSRYCSLPCWLSDNLDVCSIVFCVI